MLLNEKTHKWFKYAFGRPIMVGQLDSMMAIARRTMTTPLQPDRPTDEASQELGFRAQSHVEFKHNLQTIFPKWKRGTYREIRGMRGTSARWIRT